MIILMVLIVQIFIRGKQENQREEGDGSRDEAMHLGAKECQLPL